jgi:hypothetical protein
VEDLDWINNADFLIPRYACSCPNSGNKADMPGLRIRAKRRHRAPLSNPPPPE